jgi:hypothetical protein
MHVLIWDKQEMMAYMMIIPEYPLRQPLDSVTEITVVLHMIISGWDLKLCLYQFGVILNTYDKT